MVSNCNIKIRIAGKWYTHNVPKNQVIKQHTRLLKPARVYKQQRPRSARSNLLKLCPNAVHVKNKWDKVLNLKLSQLVLELREDLLQQLLQQVLHSGYTVLLVLIHPDILYNIICIVMQTLHKCYYTRCCISHSLHITAIIATNISNLIGGKLAFRMHTR